MWYQTVYQSERSMVPVEENLVLEDVQKGSQLDWELALLVLRGPKGTANLELLLGNLELLFVLYSGQEGMVCLGDCKCSLAGPIIKKL